LKSAAIPTLGTLIDRLLQSARRQLAAGDPAPRRRPCATHRRLTEPFKATDTEIIEVGGRHHVLVPLKRMALAPPLADANGANRSPAFFYVTAHTDLEAIGTYLHQYGDQPKTLRVYTKELERILLWCVTVHGKDLSSVLADDCETYKDIRKAPTPQPFVGPRAPRRSGRWRPFASSDLAAESQKYAVRALRAAFAWLVDVRYLAGNHRKAVKGFGFRGETQGRRMRRRCKCAGHHFRLFLSLPWLTPFGAATGVLPPLLR